MDNCIAWERPDGGITIEYFGEGQKERALLQTAERLLQKYGAPAIPHEIDSVVLPEPPEDERFFNTWEWGIDRPVVNLNKARIIHMDAIRIVRDEELKKLDVEFLIALENGDIPKQEKIVSQKKILRDIPQLFDLDLYNTPEELKVSWPIELL
jgi:hypothetical protein